MRTGMWGVEQYGGQWELWLDGVFVMAGDKDACIKHLLTVGNDNDQVWGDTVTYVKCLRVQQKAKP